MLLTLNVEKIKNNICGVPEWVLLIKNNPERCALTLTKPRTLPSAREPHFTLMQIDSTSNPSMDLLKISK
jgi:hypothetical protein